jgi:hypothetical protein
MGLYVLLILISYSDVMGKRYVKASAPLVIGLMFAIPLAFHFWKPPAFYRDGRTEARGLVALAPSYLAYYTDCTDGRDMGVLGLLQRKLVAENDADAVAFARAVLPACRLYLLQRKRRTYFDGGFSTDRRVDIDLRRY